ncbi:MAG TPA: histidinol dehydrogenase [Feifaniaceae bacterium]|nr:histidinol dehydrogenase [Feifaniaceae bacterium]
MEYDKAEQTVREILADVKENGDGALKKYSLQFDHAELSSLAVTETEIKAALSKTDSRLLFTMRQAAENIRAFHRKQKREGFVMAEREGTILGQRILPLDRVGLYIPGGTASYPSTVLMNAIPAKIAGVKEIVMVTPPASDGSVAPPILAAAYIAGVDKVYKVGGAQAIAALAYGTESIPRVDKITGPGNMYVATAKRQVYGLVDIDMVAGPSEILIIADDSADPFFVAADLLSQAEHDPMAAAILLTTGEELALAVQSEVSRQLYLLPRRVIAEKSILDHGRIVVVSSLQEAAEWSNEVAPEHLELCVEDPFALLARIRHAGSVFLGHYAPEALGDYFAGPNHTLPTNGTAKFASPLSVDDFIKKSSFVYYSREALREVREEIEFFARNEGLDAHAKSVGMRFDFDEDGDEDGGE